MSLEGPLTKEEQEYVRRAEELRKAGKLKEAEEWLQILKRFTLCMGTKFEYDFHQDGFEIKEDVEPIYGTVVFDPRSFLQSSEASIGGHHMRPRAVEMNANLGQLDAEKILKLLNSRAGTIRSRRLSQSILVFPGTVWERSHLLCVPVLVRKSGKWKLELRDLSLYWSAECRFLVFRQVTISRR
jgi:hypothetical protein